ncbi:MAG: helix-turn-helix domain-containing protein [Desulfobacterales bacterium]|nr:helix-turn-helix domain-containing protein [Desulfobacterales bacterium]
MANSTETKAKAARSIHTAYWQQEWMTKVYSDGCCSFAKLLFVRIASFGERGCWMTNEALGEECNRSERTIQRAVTSLWRNGDLIITGWNGHGRKMYAAGNEKARQAIELDYSKMRKKGKVKDVHEFRAKVRMRLKPETPEN